MSELFFISFIIFVVTGLIYLLYKILLGSGEKNNAELQITSRELLEQVKFMYKQKKYNIVETLAKKYLEKKFDDVDIRTVLIKAYIAEDRLFDAVEHAKVILKLQPKNHDIKLLIADCYFRVGKSSKAIKHLQELVEDDPGNSIAMRNLAEIYVKTNQKMSALKTYKKLDEYLENNQDKLKNKLTMAQLHLEFGEYDSAIEEYKSAMELYPADVKVKRRLIELYDITADYAMLMQLCNDILMVSAQDENGLWALEMFVKASRKIKDFDKAFQTLEQMRQHPLAETIKIDKMLAEVLLEKGQIDESIDLLKLIVSREASNPEIKKALAKSYEAKLDFVSAVDIYKEILDEADASQVNLIHSEISNLYSNWAIHLFLNEETDECFKKFTLALKYYTENPEIYYNLANINKIIRNYNEAVKQFKKAIELDSENPDYYYSLAECYEEMQITHEQKKALLDCLALDPSNAKAHFKLGVLYDMQNDGIAAMESIRKAIELDEDYNEAKRKLALMLEHIGNKEEAISLYEEILKHEPDNMEVLNNLKMLKAQ